MKTALLICALLTALVSTTALGGQVVYQSLYVAHTLVQGTGKTYGDAEKDALAAVPKFFQRDPRNSQSLECTISEILLLATNGEKCDTSIPGNLFRVTIPIIDRRLLSQAPSRSGS